MSQTSPEPDCYPDPSTPVPEPLQSADIVTDAKPLWKRATKYLTLIIATTVTVFAITNPAEDMLREYEEKAASCQEALEELQDSMTELPTLPARITYSENFDPALTHEVNRFTRAHKQVLWRCPIQGDTEYMRQQDVALYNQMIWYVYACLDQVSDNVVKCDEEYLYDSVYWLNQCAHTMEVSTAKVPRWSTRKQTWEFLLRVLRAPLGWVNKLYIWWDGEPPSPAVDLATACASANS